MSERYGKLFSLPENLYAEGSPVLVAAGNLLKDTQTGKILAQLKLKSISRSTIKAARVVLVALDTMGKPLDSETEKEYLDLSVGQGEEFGQKTAIPLPNASTRGFAVRVKQIIFADNSTWDGTDAAWEPVPAAESLLHKLGDEETVRQYRLKFGGKCEVAAREHKDLWLCACGIWNREPKCCGCGKEKSALLNLDPAALTAEKDARLAKEKADREAKEAAEKEAREKSAKKTKKLLSIAVPAVILLVAALLLVTMVLIPNSRYDKANALLEAGDYDAAIVAFEALGGYKDSEAQIGIAKEAKIEAENAAAYAEAEALFSKGDLDGAAAAFKTLGDYRDSAKRAGEALEAKAEQERAEAYARAKSLLSAGEYDEAIAAFEALGDYRDSAEQAHLAGDAKIEAANAAAYAEAEAILASGDLEGARTAFLALGSYKDCEQRAALIRTQIEERNAQALLAAKAGDRIVFGAYEQDGDPSNGKEDIVWIVLSREGDRLLVISEKALDCLSFNRYYKDVTWETCTLRVWLNDEFLNAAFSEEEQGKIPTVTVSADMNTSRYSNAVSGNATRDRVFLLSIPETEKYFSSEIQRSCRPSAQAEENGCRVFNNGNCLWWLRTPGEKQHDAAGVDDLGRIIDDWRVSSDAVAVRPAIWIDLGA